MDGTAQATHLRRDPSSKASTPALGDTTGRMAGLGGIAFVAIVILQNLIRGTSAPGNGATGDQ